MEYRSVVSAVMNLLNIVGQSGQSCSPSCDLAMSVPSTSKYWTLNNTPWRIPRVEDFSRMILLSALHLVLWWVEKISNKCKENTWTTAGKCCGIMYHHAPHHSLHQTAIRGLQRKEWSSVHHPAACKGWRFPNSLQRLSKHLVQHCRLKLRLFLLIPRFEKDHRCCTSKCTQRPAFCMHLRWLDVLNPK